MPTEQGLLDGAGGRGGRRRFREVLREARLLRKVVAPVAAAGQAHRQSQQQRHDTLGHDVMMTAGGEIRHDLVLVGGGHTHVQVLRAWAMRPVPGVRLTVVVDRPEAVYSGMVPGFVAGQYRREDLEIDVRPLALRAGARFIVTPAVGLDPRERLIHLAGRPPLRYDTAAFDVGSTVAGLALPGVREHALASRPIGRFVEHVEALVARARERGRCRLVAVGAGAGGVELAFAFRARLEREGVREASVLLLESGRACWPAIPPAPRAGWRPMPARAASRSGWARVWPKRARRSSCWRTVRASRSTRWCG